MNPLHFDISDVLFILLVILLIFLAIREVLCWYWKINARLSVQKDTLKILEDILDEVRKQGNRELNIPTMTNSMPEIVK